jgi:hypothetical protein
MVRVPGVIGKYGLSIVVEKPADSILGEYGSVIFIGAILDGVADALRFGAGAGFPPQAAVNRTTDQPAPIADRRAAMFTHVILNASPEPRLNTSAAVDATRAELALQ